MLNESREWYWEGNVQHCIAKHLEADGWTCKLADCAKQQHGIDISAARGTETLLVEVKGYPSELYQTGEKKGTPKTKTKPASQAWHWYAKVLLQALERKAEKPEARIAIGLPKQDVYLRLLSKTENALAEVGIIVFLVSQHPERGWAVDCRWNTRF